MRAAWIVVAVAGCYDPQIRAGSPCSETNPCPNELRCTDGVCGGGTGVDAGSTDATGATDATAGEFTCPTGYTLRAPTSCHRVVATPLTWQAAEMMCEADGAHLVVVDDAAENAAVPASPAHWIGYSAIISPGTYHWVTGATSTYTGWGPGEPQGTLSTCVHTENDGWHNDPCGQTHAFVCEYDGRPADPDQF